MCGICGQVTFEAPWIMPEVIRAMTATLVHRGPDDEGYFFQPQVGLGMRRLRVVDLVTGQQPMANEDQSVWVVFNGEIYNHRALRERLQRNGHHFRTASDTEVIAHLYEERGPECVRELNGMFAFAIWDVKQQQLFLARDPLGIKPLYYYARPGRLAFASELKALLADAQIPRNVDPSAVADYFQWLYIPAPYTIFQEIKKLPPGSWLLMSANGLRQEQYWDVQFTAPTQQSGADDHALTERVLTTLRSAVRRQMVADVPVGVFLSGGLDSSGIVALARECTTGTLQTFSAGFPGMGLYDERPYAQRVAEQFGCEHHALDMNPSAVAALETVVRACDEPFGDSSAIPLYYLAQFARGFVTVALSGTGGDDLFAGYRRYWMARWLARYQRLPAGVRRGLAHAVAGLPAHRRSRWGEYGMLLKRFCAAAENGASLQAAYLKTVTHFDGPLRQELLPLTAEAHGVAAWSDQERGGDPLEACLRADLSTYLPDDLLVKEDRMTMAVGLEARVPFLDAEVVELALRIPGRLKLCRGSTKYILRQALKPLLPDAIVRRPKHGFAVPVNEWFCGELVPLLHDLVLSPTARSRSWLEPRVVRQLVEQHLHGREALGQQLWAMLVFESWLRQYGP